MSPRLTVRCVDDEDIPADTVIVAEDGKFRVYAVGGEILTLDLDDVRSIIAGRPARDVVQEEVDKALRERDRELAAAHGGR